MNLIYFIFILQFNKYQFDVKGLFDAVRNYLSDTNENLNSTQNFDQYIGLNNHNRFVFVKILLNY